MQDSERVEELRGALTRLLNRAAGADRDARAVLLKTAQLCSDCAGRGWSLFGDDLDETLHVERCDTCQKCIDDDAAEIEALVYLDWALRELPKMCEALKEAVDVFERHPIEFDYLVAVQIVRDVIMDLKE